jgi:hypothetical protein
VRTKRPARAIAAAAACLVVVAGCGGGGGETVTTEALTPTAAMEKVASSVKSVETSSYTFEMAGAGLSMKGHGAFRTKPEPAMQMVFDSMSMGGSAGGLGLGNMGDLGGMEQRIIGDTLYMRGAFLSMLGGGQKWMKLSFGELGAAAGMNLKSMMTQATQADPRAQLQALLAAGDVKSVGTETIDGVKTTHYTGEVDVADLAKNAQIDDRTRAELENSYTAAQMGTTHLDVWIDESFQARRFVSTSDTPMGDVTMTMNFTDYGKAVEISAPPAAEVMDMSSLAKAGSMGGAPKAS